eukprot:16191-Heterococcus_DN1.PRE.2
MVACDRVSYDNCSRTSKSLCTSAAFLPDTGSLRMRRAVCMCSSLAFRGLCSRHSSAAVRSSSVSPSCSIIKNSAAITLQPVRTAAA